MTASWRPGPVRRVHPRRAWDRAGAALTLAFILLVLGGILALIPLPYVVMQPGPATDTLGRVEGRPILNVTGARTYPTSGRLYFTTVRVVGGPGHRVNAYDVLGGWLRSPDEVLPESQVFPPDATAAEVQEENAAEMAASQEVAAASALRLLGRPVRERVVVASVLDNSPAKGVLRAEDELVSVAGRPARDVQSVRRTIQAQRPGTELVVTVRRGGRTTALTARTGEQQGRTVLGVALRRDYDLPIRVTIDAGAVGGPSAGLMFTLGIYDVLTPGPLPGGKVVAGTGTVDDTGAVGPIGGIRQKLTGAKRAGAGWFLAPSDNCDELGGHVPQGLQVLSIRTVADARSAVEAIAAGRTAGLRGCGTE